MMCCFSDIMNFINWKHAAPTFTNFELLPEKFNKYTFYRSILENTAMLVKGHIELVKEATGNEPLEGKQGEQMDEAAEAPAAE